MFEFYKKEKPKARKEHICEYCGQKIHKGETYSCETGKYDGDMFVRKLCLTCENILDEFCKENREEELSWVWISDWLADFFCYDCKHGSRGDDDCEMQPHNCPLMRKRFAPK